MMSALLRAALCAAAVVAFSGCAARAGQPVLADHLEWLSAMPHGLYRLPPEGNRRVEDLKANPAATVAAIEERFRGVDLLRLKGKDARVFGVTLMVLGLLDGLHTRPLLVSWFDVFDRAPRTTAGRQRHVVLGLLAATPDPTVTRRILGELGSADIHDRSQSLKYLARAGRGDARLADALEGAMREAASPLRDDPSVHRLLLIMRGGIPASNPPTTPASILDRLQNLLLNGMEPIATDRALIDQVVGAPATYAPLLAARLSATDLEAVGREPIRTHVASMLWLLGRLGEAGRSAVQSVYLRLDAVLFKPQSGLPRPAIIELRRNAFSALGFDCDVVVAQWVLSRLHESPPSWRQAPLDWLGAACRGNEMVVGEFRELVESNGLVDPSGGLNATLWKLMRKR